MPEKKKRVLMLASVASMIEQFNMPNIKILLEAGYEVHAACNYKTGSTCSEESVKELKKELECMNVRCFQVDFTRKVWKLKQDIIAYIQVKRLCDKYRYSFIHCHSPIGGIVGRIAAHVSQIPVIYTAHGFHFYSGASFKNWLVSYPAELLLSYWTDTLITINGEDYKRAKKHFHAKSIVYIPGVGVNIEKFKACCVDRKAKRRQLGIPEEACVFLSVGELRDIKNQQLIIEAMHRIHHPDIYYLCVGQGELKDKYEKLIRKYALEEHVMILGFRKDIDELCKAADCFVHPSIREGMGIAPLEAMASGLPLISSAVRGIKDYAENGTTGCCIDPASVDEAVCAMMKIASDPEFRKRCGAENQKIVQKFGRVRVNKMMKKLYFLQGDYESGQVPV